MLKELYEILKPLGLGVTLASMSILVGVLLLPGMDYSDLNKFTSTATPYLKSLLFVIFGTCFLLYKLCAIAQRVKQFDELKQKLEKLETQARDNELRTKEIWLQIEWRIEDARPRINNAREHLRLFQDYLSFLAKLRSKAKVESSDVEAAREVCERVADHWDKADRSGGFYDFYEISHRMYPIRTALENGLKRLIGNNENEVASFCDQLYKQIDSLLRGMRAQLDLIENKLFSTDYLSSSDSGRPQY